MIINFAFMRYLIGILLLIIFSLNTSIFPQQDVADSLVLQLKHLNGKEKVHALNELSDIYQYINTKSAIEYAEQGIILASEINYKKGLAGCYGSLGFCYINLNRGKAVTFTQKALDIRRQLGDKPGIATSLNVMGVIYYYKGDYLESIEYHLKALQLREEIGDENKTAISYNNISLVYLALEDYETALDYLNKALKIRIETNNKRGIGIIKDNIGTIYRRTGNYKKSFDYLNEALTINIELGNKKSLASNYYNLANNYTAISQNKNAIIHFNFALELYRELDEKHGIANTENGIASLFMNEGKTEIALNHAHIALVNAEVIHSLDNISKAADILQSVYMKIGDYQKAYLYLSLNKNSADSLQITKKIKKLAKIEFDNKVRKIKAEQDAEIFKQNILITSLGITLFFSLIIVILIIKGYTNKRKMNDRLNELNSKLKELNSTKDRFFSIIAHDLRGPFHGMLAYSEILASDIETLNKEEIKEYSEDLNKAIQMQYELLNDLLNWSRLQNENFKINPEKVSLKLELCEIINPMSFMVAKKNIKLNYSINEDFTVFADKNMLRLVLRNLISNGIKFTGRNGFVNVSAVKKEKYDEIIITDNGMGISIQDQEKLFRIDFDHSTKGTSGETGTGIGLILCKEIVEKHSGEIKVQSEEGKGSTFSFTLSRN